MRDVEADLVSALRTLLGVAAVGVDVVRVDDHLPYVSVSTLPSQEAESTWGGPMRSVSDVVDVDIDVYATDLGAVFDTAAEVRHWLLTDAPGLPFQPVNVPVFARRPDFNERVRRRGAVVRFRARHT
ncbi:hypothetical protein [Dietzia sp. ANT_WB102]|uniref:hypothetical protein n=1 Tax=Dietzia sp. ANT_WB102 TaxID=2597345 RepID=UPI0011ED5D82|nr:hypothetical protein [Dietzia sp. ANT_WB102]KAA0916462.1 hypothetical protein FQ137_14665 [Dietzia sp. ANT_WB102]